MKKSSARNLVGTRRQLSNCTYRLGLIIFDPTQFVVAETIIWDFLEVPLKPFLRNPFDQKLLVFIFLIYNALNVSELERTQIL